MTELISKLKLNQDVCDNIKDARDAALKLQSELSDNGVIVFHSNHEDYPLRLKSTLKDNAPPVLFVKGNIKILSDLAIGFCGARTASALGIEITGLCAKQLVENGYTIVSGHAAGVDIAAHRSAVEHGGKTIFVLSEGILRFKPRQEVKDFLTSDNHVIVSQFSPNIIWNANNAMKRNETIIGLSDAMILVESKNHGGTFAAGETTLKYKHPLFVIDYKDPGPSAEANPYFIKKGGVAIRGKSDKTPNLKKIVSVTRKEYNVTEPQKALF
jgi:DNA processing protein